MRFEEKVQLASKLGLHMRPAAEIVKALQGITCDVLLKCSGKEVNARSIMGIITLAAKYKTKVTITAEGQDAEEAVSRLKEILSTNYLPN